jgi:hypothetical protein
MDDCAADATKIISRWPQWMMDGMADNNILDSAFPARGVK